MKNKILFLIPAILIIIFSFCGCSAQEDSRSIDNSIILLDDVYDRPFNESCIEIKDPEIIYQYAEGYDAGCEPAALTMCLNCYGFDVDIDTIVGTYLCYGTSEECYIGSVSGEGFCYPPAIVLAANRYLSDQGVTRYICAEEITGHNFERYLKYVNKGPVITWFTTDYNQPTWYTDSVWSNEHCILVYGYDSNYVYIADSILGFTTLDIDRFQEVWESCGGYAVRLKIA